MPSVSKKQATFMAMSAHAAGRKWLKDNGKKPAPMSVAKEFVLADHQAARKS